VSELADLIRTEIAAQGIIPFARFMELALYHPRLGYYEASRHQVGFPGDFYTSVSTGELFGQLLAFRFACWLDADPEAGGGRRMVEAGAHDGRLARDILTWLREHRPELYGQIQYWIIEPSPQRQVWQRETLREFAPQIHWGEHLHSAGRINGIIFSNELLDALPVHRFGWDASGQAWFEWGVALDGDKFRWAKIPAPTGREPAIQLPGELLRVLPDGYVVETCPAAEQWWHTAAGRLEQGWLLTLDYGFTTEEMISPGRRRGTLRAYHRHHISDDLLVNAGEQDLTAHVNFSTLQAAGERAGLTTEGYLTQPHFLTRILSDAVTDNAFRDWTARRTRQFQTLTHPEHLGRAFKVLIQQRRGGGNLPPPQFQSELPLATGGTETRPLPGAS